MKRLQITFPTAFLAVALVVIPATGAPALEVGVGQSESTDAKSAGAEAATQAKAALGDSPPKLVLVYHGSDLLDDHAKLLQGVASVFDASIVYGCSGYAPLTHHGHQAQVGVLALGGDVEVTAAVSKTAGKDDDRASGQRIGRALKKACRAESAGRLVLLFGDCHVPRNDSVVKGVSSVLGQDVPVVGGAAFKGRVYVRGESLDNNNVGILLTGDFKCGVSMLQDNSPEGLVTSARDAVRNAIGEDKDKLVLTFAFDCGGRRNMMLEAGNFPRELEAMKEVAGDTPIFGFFGSGEIGCGSPDAAPCGDGYHIATCAIFAD